MILLWTHSDQFRDLRGVSQVFKSYQSDLSNVIWDLKHVLFVLPNKKTASYTYLISLYFLHVIILIIY